MNDVGSELDIIHVHIHKRLYLQIGGIAQSLVANFMRLGLEDTNKHISFRCGNINKARILYIPINWCIQGNIGHIHIYIPHLINIQHIPSHIPRGKNRMSDQSRLSERPIYTLQSRFSERPIYT